MRTLIPVEDNDTQAAVQGFLKKLLQADVVDALLVPMETPQGAITPALVSEADLLEHASPLTPVMGLNAARLAGRVSIREPRERVGVVLRPCELRALVELVKLQQASLEDLVTIGLDCLGTYDVAVYAASLEGQGGRPNFAGLDTAAYLATAQSGDLVPQEGYAFRGGCQMCEKPHSEGADVTLELFGCDADRGIPVSLPDEMGEQLGLAPTEIDAQRAPRRLQVIEKVAEARTAVRDERFSQIRRRLDEEGIEGVFASCIRCHNCMTVCPICYCKTCLFKSPVFDHEPMLYMNWAQRKGAFRLPADTTLFHLTRLNHMALSCVGCGMCTSDCPSELPVGRVFRAIGHEVQEVFDYEPGRSVEEPLPLVTFREDEWVEVGEE
jgi:formate dehydrogenase subunit beta